MATKRESKASERFWRIVISAIGVALILMAVGNVMLFFFGENSMAKVSTRRYGGADDNRPANQRYEWALDYTFKDLEGNSHSGHTNRRVIISGTYGESVVIEWDGTTFKQEK